MLTLASVSLKLLTTFLTILLISLPLNGAGTINWQPVSKADFTVLEQAGFMPNAKGKPTPYFIGRMEYEDGVVCGIYAPSTGNFWFALNPKKSKKISNPNVQVLAYDKGITSWAVKETGKPLPYNIIMGGLHQVTKERLFICRVNHSKTGAVIPGWVSLKNDKCVIGSKNISEAHEKYEMLVLNWYGIVTDAVS